MSERDLLYVDADPVTSLPSYSGDELRMAFQGYQAGVFGSINLKVTPGVAGLTVDVDAGRGIVFSQFAGAQAGFYYGIYNDAVVNSANFEAGGIPANASANPRLDAVVARVWDHTYDGTGQRKWRIVYVTGSPSAGAALGGTLPSLPISSLLLAEVLVPGSNPTSIPAGNIRDRRPWARGAFSAITRTGGDLTRTSATPILLDSTFLYPRYECSGNVIRVAIDCNWFPAIADKSMGMDLFIDGVGQGDARFSRGSAIAGTRFVGTWLVTPSPGTHQIGPALWSLDGVTQVTVKSTVSEPLFMTVEEIVRPSTSNG